MQDPPNPNRVPLLPRSPSPPDVPDQVNYSIAANDETSMSIDTFPGGDAGAPIAVRSLNHSESDHVSISELSYDNIWAPFCSQRDWEFAHWVKTCGPTSSAVTNLLAIPGVRIFDKLCSNLLIHCRRIRLLRRSDFLMAASKSLTGSSTRHFLDAQYSSARHSLLAMKPWSFIIGKSYHVSGVSMGTLSSLTILYSHRNATIQMQVRHVGFLTRCTQAIGGGPSRYVCEGI